MTEDHKRDLDRDEDQDDHDMGGGSDVKEPSDHDHLLLDKLLEKDRGAASPVPTPEPRYLSYEKDGSKKSDTPASSDPAAKPKPKPKSRSTDDPKSSKDTGLEEEDQESEADTSADGDDDESLNDMLQAQTLMALSRSRSEQRRRDHAAPRRTGAGGAGDPGSGGDSDGDGSSNGSGGGGGGSPVDPAGMPLYNIADVDPWVIQRINTLTIMTMTLEVLSRALPFRPEWIFPSHLPRAAVPRSGQYCSHLITGQNVRDLMAALPWNVLTGANIPEPMSFEITVDGRLGFLIERYSAVEFQDLIAYWESTHRFPVSSALIRSDPYLAAFVVERKNRRSHAGTRWKQILRLFLIAMREGWCDLDLLLDPYFPSVAWYPGIEARSVNIADPQLNRREPADLIEALAECDAADPWRNHYRLHHAGHPARRIARLVGKFFNMAALNPNAPPLAPQP
ncbi:hypothetical protein PHMEG_00033826 [Phytophthora megakarya]|uniref:Uncharacterized protein n=1 Tax=Phytophthora megakarya TaxID=4795 RepID=A0A225USP0_9STRA|nr:hypothetical protein PHMEG_00033826 [Phytophthora megakarya]